MTETKVPTPPAGTGRSGRRLWTDVFGAYALEEHEMALLREMVRAVDRLDALDAIVRRQALTVAGPGLTTRVHPAAVEARQLGLTLPRLAGALRFPAGEDGDHQAGARPQRRVGVRGAYGIRGVVR
jgi:hypothetical protein